MLNKTSFGAELTLIFQKPNVKIRLIQPQFKVTGFYNKTMCLAKLKNLA